MKRFELISFPSDQALAKAAAGRWLDVIAAAQRAGKKLTVALSGGRIARTFFEAAVSESIQRNAAWTHVHFFWADERCVPPNDPENNFAIAQKLLFGPLAIADGQIHRIQGELDPSTASAQAADKLLEWTQTKPGGTPILDLVFLGMGEDGHVASLFPGDPVDVSASAPIYRPVKASKPPPMRISLGYPTIFAAREAYVLVSGPGKEPALKESVRGVDSTPLAYVLNRRQGTLVLTSVKLP